MPILPQAHSRPVEALRRVGQRIYFITAGAPAASLVVALVAFGLEVVHVSFGSVAGAFLIVFAQRLAQKRLSPTALVVPPTPEIKPLKRVLEGPRMPTGPSS
jgi:hypothetical protein